MKLVFTNEEQMCISYLVQCLIKADGLVAPEENVCWNTIAIKLGWPESDKVLIAEGYELNNALSVLSVMNADKKRFATAFFKMIVLADQQIAPEEMDLLEEIVRGGLLPEIHVAECAIVLDEYLN